MASFESKTLRMKIPAILDTGSSVSLIPYSYVKGREVEKELIKTDVKITGVTPGYSPIMGQLECNVTIGEDCKFHNIICYVTSQQIPCLVGNNLLRHKSVVSFSQDNVNQRVTMKRLVNNVEESFEIQQFEKSRDQSHVTSNFSGNSKLEWLKSHGINFPVATDPEHHNEISNDDIRKVAELLMKYPEIMGSEDNQGLFTE